MEARFLITAEQVRRIAGEEKLSAGVVEKDYALTWLLSGLYLKSSELKDIFALKGGTAIRKVYFPQTWRFSEDLDFTVVGQGGAEKIRGSMEKVFETLLSESGIRYSLDSFHATPSAIIANVQYFGPLNQTNRIKHDITLKEKVVLEPEQRTIAGNYPDLPDFRILTYSLAEILVEKIRSIMQRGYSRDYYDVWRLLKDSKSKDSKIRRLLIRKCEMNGINYEPELLFDRKRLDEARSFWTKGLGYLTKELPEFESVVSELKDWLRFLL